jgi:hypothetical protein
MAATIRSGMAAAEKKRNDDCGYEQEPNPITVL